MRRSSLLRRVGGSDSDRGSMAILLMVVLVGMMLSAIIVPVIITQDRTTKFDTTRVQALDAAQSGIDVTLGIIRASVGTDNIGDSTKLPCSPTDSSTSSPGVAESGMVNSTGIAAYSVVIEYFMTDPVAEAYPSANALKCAPGYGPYQRAGNGVAGGPVTPRFARLTSTGTVGAAVNGSTAGRTLTSTYKFKTSDTNIAGGVIPILPLSTGLCMDAGANPAVATPVTLQPCSTSIPPAAGQTFAYRSDLTLQLLSSVTTANPNGFCIAYEAAAAASNAIRLAQCGALGSPPYTQQWSFNDWGHYQASDSNSASTGNLPKLCMNASASAGQPVTVVSSTDPICHANPDVVSTWAPSSSLGAGGAALPQWVNFQEFGRCMDVANLHTYTDHLFDYPCKQNPFRGALTWNQLFQAPAIPAGSNNVTGQITTTVPAGNTDSTPGTYCLTSPGSDGRYVTVAPCTSGSSSQQWTIYGGDKSLAYSDKYKITVVAPGGSVLCLGLTAPAGDGWSAIDVENCTGALDQKWNASPSVLAPGLKDTGEK